MANRFKTKSLVTNFSYSCKSLMAECKVRLIITYALLIISVFLGIFVAIRLNNEGILDRAVDYGYVDFSLFKISSLSSFIRRFFSFALFIALLVLFSTTIFLFPIGEIILIYRGYLVGLNLAIIIIVGGLGGIFTSLLIILPCQIIAIFILSTFFCIYSKQIKSYNKDKWKFIGIALLLLLVLDIVEALLLMIFGANMILVI